MWKFDIKTYNNFHPIAAANARFDKQLSYSGITRAELFSELSELFLEGVNAGQYAPCLIHRHYCLNEGERMVTSSNSTRPSRDRSLNIVAERWLKTGEEFEYRFTDNPASLAPPPSIAFMARFKSIVEENGIDVLGVCYAPTPSELAPGFVYSETVGQGDREQVLNIVHQSSLQGEKTYQTSWVPTLNPQDQSFTMSCTHNCVGCLDNQDDIGQNFEIQRGAKFESF
ncbi:hypothetical protein GALMADRAFT_213379 [Galerina marginata CBS 339.88]|uniref:Uncharacterized protein n=1 Tax=Galerina marginata (strain CBS 339.88) TaxID=685588 RepID=A0A067SNA8_GALM3|nr:hypothetical protein GALMADRAFT_213379 [Galerina marginata CBS 339.88]